MSRRTVNKKLRIRLAARIKGKDAEKVTQLKGRILNPNLEPVRTYPHGTSETIKREFQLREIQKNWKPPENPNGS